MLPYLKLLILNENETFRQINLHNLKIARHKYRNFNLFNVGQFNHFKAPLVNLTKSCQSSSIIKLI